MLKLIKNKKVSQISDSLSIYNFIDTT